MSVYKYIVQERGAITAMLRQYITPSKKNSFTSKTSSISRTSTSELLRSRLAAISSGKIQIKILNRRGR